ncbi:TrkH family potassium uptake protein [Pseudochrobactrum sp. HB0163]|uniref:TrkH family potassium uptake protein n=1 Tax=Pseudochrobactrum sp. HB0163 TaxID=3450708 RepID=UPI003F6E3818
MAVAMLFPAIFDLRDGTPDWLVFIRSSVFTAVASSLVFVATRHSHVRFSPRLGFLLTVSLWVTAALLGSIPFYFSHLPISFAKALFEATSGITATGSTALTGLDQMPRGILIWRSLLCWIGGIGFIGLALLLLPSLRIGGVQLFHMESSDKSEKILPRVNQLATGIIIAYCGLTTLCIISFFAAGMGMFDAINHGLTTISTAGYSTHDASFGYFNGNNAILLIAMAFMILGSMPFILYIKAVIPQQMPNLLDPQVKLFLSLVLLFTFGLAVMLRANSDMPFGTALITAGFHFISVITTTGFATEDYTLWGPAAIGIFFLASFIGGCAGSTSGGMKINRIIILWRITQANLTRLVMPHAIVKARYGTSEITGDIAQSALLYLFLYFSSLVLGTMALAIFGLDFVSAFTGALTALSNVGPGLGETIGPAGNFSTINDNALWVLSYLMLAGRLELITVVILFTRAFWVR